MDKNYGLIRLNRKTAKIFRDYCRENNLDAEKFLEEAIVEKLEMERLAADSDYYNYSDATGDELQLELFDGAKEKPEIDNYKRRH